MRLAILYAAPPNFAPTAHANLAKSLVETHAAEKMSYATSF